MRRFWVGLTVKCDDEAGTRSRLAADRREKERRRERGQLHSAAAPLGGVFYTVQTAC